MLPPMKPTRPLSHFRRLAAFLLVAGLLPGLLVAAGAVSSTEKGMRLLQTELPARVTLLDADCEQLAAAVGKATLVHQPEAPAILRAALTRGLRKLQRSEGKLPSACAQRIFSVSVAAAPTQASALLDLATELYPDAAAELAGALRDYDRVSYDYKDRVIDNKNVVDDRSGSTHAAPDASDPSVSRQVSTDPFASVQDPGDLSARDINGLGFSDSYGFGAGFGPGFPGSPGFVGSTPDGGFALPPAPVTAAVNG